MKCPHCLVEIHADEHWTYLGKDSEGHWGIKHYLCPNPDCKKGIFYLVIGSARLDSSDRFLRFNEIHKSFLVYPKGSNRPPVPPQVPEKIAEDYVEACIVLSDSPKASAALSRRCLQNLLREVANVKPGNLADEIQEVIDSKSLPSYLTEDLDRVRLIGNFSAHPTKSKQSGEIIPVEPQEAEWNLDVLEGLFDFYFVQPEIMKQKRVALDKKLEDAGKKGN
ncbi:MAG: DUF4145 domain-containing protein [Methanocellales archaeon]|nr:DUF4145 domain-containing protein [Methanocellales archaeon]MDD3291564.1 DUF4145 domain-containing protein [Methanocellales archaeon]MDD5235853.1 DUF4145 domain-containing protein [Methanocellales archaeon]MDD5485346.1 DUF4145 domain-containing protein [Methanocellales archaeon]